MTALIAMMDNECESVCETEQEEMRESDAASHFLRHLHIPD